MFTSLYASRRSREWLWITWTLRCVRRFDRRFVVVWQRRIMSLACVLSANDITLQTLRQHKLDWITWQPAHTVLWKFAAGNVGLSPEITDRAYYSLSKAGLISYSLSCHAGSSIRETDRLTAFYVAFCWPHLCAFFFGNWFIPSKNFRDFCFLLFCPFSCDEADSLR